MPQMLANARKFIDTTPYREFPYDEESMRSEFVSMMEHGLCVIAEEDDIHLGGVGAVKGPLFLDKRVSIAGERFWWVEPNERAAGVGKALLQAIHVAAKEAGCTYLMMLSLDDAADKLYAKLGFDEVEHAFMKRL